ncbi:hypothetical protein JOB18_009621 [Solea senegalensis]|nr:hypothetical protein JOB18_009621 [Solea senegalensis]
MEGGGQPGEPGSAVMMGTAMPAGPAAGPGAGQHMKPVNGTAAGGGMGVGGPGMEMTRGQMGSPKPAMQQGGHGGGGMGGIGGGGMGGGRLSVVQNQTALSFVTMHQAGHCKVALHLAAGPPMHRHTQVGETQPRETKRIRTCTFVHVRMQTNTDKNTQPSLPSKMTSTTPTSLT